MQGIGGPLLHSARCTLPPFPLGVARETNQAPFTALPCPLLQTTCQTTVCVFMLCFAVWRRAAGRGAAQGARNPALPVLSLCRIHLPSPPQAQLATLRTLARSMAHQHSSAAISDRAGERLADDIMAPLGERERRQGEEAAASSSSRDMSASVGGLSGAGSSSRRGVAVQPVVQQPPPQRGPPPV